MDGNDEVKEGLKDESMRCARGRRKEMSDMRKKG